ncbi:MAG: hypothetical protein OXR64_00325 [Chloroflexota bacterium]|nr:hypothetical protein [Chloroflexota bacterium]MDE2918273.1 hypothetical protein [Chloroflexota bacterium]
MATGHKSVASRGKELYVTRIRELTRATAKGDFVVIDIRSGDFEVDSDDLAATMRLMERRPDAITWAERVGYPAAYNLQGGILARTE